MNDKKLHSSHLEEEGADFFSKGKIKWEKSETEVWNELSEKISAESSGKKFRLISSIIKYAAAAIIFLVLGFGTLTFFYQKSVVCLPGEHLTVELPDESLVQLNADSRIKYYPLKWRFERKVYLEGEAYFVVQKGKKFVVKSVNGATEVLGTSFNIYARDDKYEVACLTGSVKVSSEKHESVVLNPGSVADIEQNEIVVKKDYNVENFVSWTKNEFFFDGTPLKEVFNEIERQYGVTIKVQQNIENRNFGSNFSKKYDVEEVLDYVCTSMQIKFVKQSENVFLVLENN